MNYYAIINGSGDNINVLVVSRGRYLSYDGHHWYDNANGPAFFRGDASNDIEEVAKSEAESIARSMDADLAGAAAFLKG